MIALLRRLGLICVVVVLVAGCGGGGGSDSLPDPNDAGDSAGSEPDGDGSGDDSTGGDSGDAGLSAFASEMLAAVNAERADAGQAALGWDPLLAQAATAHAQDMETNDFFSHLGSDGSEVGDRVHAAGYAYSAVGENIAWNYQSVAAVMAGWMGSDGHRANILQAEFTEMGAAWVGDYWVQVFATPLNPAKPETPTANG